MNPLVIDFALVLQADVTDVKDDKENRCWLQLSRIYPAGTDPDTMYRTALKWENTNATRKSLIDLLMSSVFLAANRYRLQNWSAAPDTHIFEPVKVHRIFVGQPNGQIWIEVPAINSKTNPETPE